jgi:hypothetical protein
MKTLLVALTFLTFLGASLKLSADLPQKSESLEDELKFKAGDEQGNETKALKTELLINRNDEKAVKQLQKLLSKYKGTAMEASLNFRLGELYMRRAKTANFFEMRRDDSNAVKFSPVEVKAATSKAWIQKAIATYDAIEKRFTHYQDMDLVLFNNGFAREMVGQIESAVTRYKRVIEDFSSSSLVPDCHLSIGEAYFNKKQFQLSYDELQKIRQFPEARVYPYGLYKGAWALYNLRRTNDGLKQLEEVVSYSKQNRAEGSLGGQLDLSREALDDMVAFYEDARTPSDAVSYFRDQAGDARAGELVLKLGKLYQRHGRFKNMEIVFSHIIDKVPLIAERPQMHKDLMDGFELLRLHEKVIDNLETLAGLCDEKSSWTKANSLESHKVCFDSLEETAKLYSSKWHREFLKNQDSEQKNIKGVNSRRAYQALLNHSKTFEGEDKLRFSFSELLFQLQDYLLSSQQYSRVAHLTKDSKLRHDSSYAALVALEKSIKDKWPDKEESLFNALAIDYIKMNPKGEFVADIKFKKAFIAYDKGRLTEAAPQLKTLAELAQNNFERSRRAAQLYLDILNIQKNYQLLSQESLAFAKKLKVDEKTKTDFIKIHRQAEFTVFQNLELDGSFKEAVAGYSRLVQEDPTSPFADKALYNAIRCANLMADLRIASKLSETLLLKYPETSYRLEVLRNLAAFYESQAQLGLAAKTLERLSRLEKENSLSDLLLSADYYALNTDWEFATRIYGMLAKNNSNTNEGKLALERLATLSEKRQIKTDAFKFFQMLIELGVQPAASLAEVKLTQWAYDAGDEDKAFRLAKKIISMRAEKNVSVHALAQARFIQGLILEREFNQASVKASPERLPTVLAIKTEKLERVQKAYQDTIQFGDSQVSLEALIRLAKCYGSFTGALSTIQPPLESTEIDKKKFNSEIENMSFPLEEKNAETLALALKQAKKLEMRDGVVARIQFELDRLSKRTRRFETVVELKVPESILPVVN